MNVNKSNPSFAGWVKPLNGERSGITLNTANIVSVSDVESELYRNYTEIKTNAPENNTTYFQCDKDTIMDAIHRAEKDPEKTATFMCWG